MAVQNSQSSTENSLEIKLNEVFLGKRRLRYIYLYQPNIVSIELGKEKQWMPLYLGCDVLDECSISSANLPRFHAKHAKRGLATKLNFQSGVRVVGIHGTTRGVWFYSIQGLFKIAFEYYTREEQQDCLCKLQEVWQRQIFDPILETEIHVKFKAHSIEPETSCGLTLEPTKKRTDCSSIISDRSDVDQFVYHINKAIGSFLCENNESLQHDVELLKTYLSYMSHKENSDLFLNRTLNLINNCLKLLPTVSENLESLGSLSDSYMSYLDDTTYDNLTSSNSSSSTTSQNKIYAEDKQHFCSKEAVIIEIAQWLGKEFLNYHAEISERVISFKQRNMRSIGNLPPAENLVNEVFPFSMQVFLCSWLQVPLAGNESCGYTEGSDNRANLFPMIQLILELANQSLVSGVAHVLFSQLVQSDSVQ